jgi:hypothetical protein
MADNNNDGGGEVLINGEDMADDQLLADDDIFVYTGGEQEVPRDVRRAKIDESIDTILAEAFADCGHLIEVEGHNKLKKIERSAFNDCYSLRWLTKMTGVTEIEGWAFFGCEALSYSEFDKLEIIGYAAFAYCDSLRSLNLPSIRRVGVCAFNNCTALTEAAFGEDLKKIEIRAFVDCPSLRRIAIPLNDNLIVEDASFNWCKNLSRVDVIGGAHETIFSLHMKSWRDEMKEEIESINQTLPDTQSATKGAAIQQWIERVLARMGHYKTEHLMLVKEAMTLLELALWKANLDKNEFTGVTSQDEGVRVTRGKRKRARREVYITSGAAIIIKNVLPFLELK